MDLMVSVITYKLAYIKANIVNNVRFRCATISVSGGLKWQCSSTICFKWNL